MRIIIQGDFFDCQLIRDRVFLWDTYGVLMVLDIRQTMYNLIKEHGRRFEYIIHKDIVEKYVISTLKIKGGIFPVDSAYMGEHLYTATESGLYRRYLQEGEKIAELPRGLAKKLIDIRFVELATKTDMMAMAGASEGLFELYNPRKYRITKSGHEAAEIEKGIYSVNRTYSKSVWYDKQDIISVNKEGYQYRCRYNAPSRKGVNGKILRNFIKRDLIGKQNLLVLPTKETVSNNSREVYTLITDNSGDITYQFMMRRFEKPVEISSKPRKFLFGAFGMAAEAKKELIIVRKSGDIKRVEGPITKARVVSGFGKKEGFLVIVRNDHVMITDCENEE